MAKSTNYSILADVVLNLDNIQKQLNSRKYDININTKLDSNIKTELSDIDKETKDLAQSTEDLGFTYQQFSMIADACVNALTSMYTQVLELDSAITEFKKVSDLQGESLNNYVGNLTEAGKQVARTGKPNRSEPVCCDGKAA